MGLNPVRWHLTCIRAHVDGLASTGYHRHCSYRDDHNSDAFSTTNDGVIQLDTPWRDTADALLMLALRRNHIISHHVLKHRRTYLMCDSIHIYAHPHFEPPVNTFNDIMMKIVSLRRNTHFTTTSFKRKTFTKLKSN